MLKESKLTLTSELTENPAPVTLNVLPSGPCAGASDIVKAVIVNPTGVVAVAVALSHPTTL
jgi:hypothetical protein